MKQRVLRLLFAIVAAVALFAIIAVAGCKKAITYYTVTFDSNGGSNVAAVEVEDGKKVAKPDNPDKEGYTFECWLDADEQQYNFDSAVTSDITLYAKWKENSSTDGDTSTAQYYSVEFNCNGGSEVKTQLVESGKKAAEPELPVKENFTFGGWYKDETCSDGNEFNFDTAVTADITLYAKWTERSSFEVTFNSNGGSDVISQEVAKGGKAVEDFDVPSRENFTFGGWYTDKDCSDGKEYDFDTPVTSDITLYAKWTPVASQPTVIEKTYTYDYSLITGLADKDTITAMTGGNSFLTVVDNNVTYRHKDTDASTSPNCIENKNGGLTVTFNGTGTITISFASTGTKNTSSLALKDADGNNLTAASAGSNLTKLDADDSLGNEAGSYQITGTTADTVTFNITEAGTYTIYCQYSYIDGSETKSRGARITAVSMTDNVEQ